MKFELRLTAPPLSARVSRETVASTLAKLVASGSATSKAELGRATGLSRTTVDAGVQTLIDIGALRVGGIKVVPGRGRPAETLELDPEFGIVLVADCGSTHASLAVFDLGQRMIDRVDIDIRLDAGPERVLPDLGGRFSDMLERLGRPDTPRSLVMGLPGPVDHWGGAVVRPPIMPGWDGYPVVDRMRELLGGPVMLENDVNLRALGEARAAPLTRGPLLYVKVGTGIGVGIVGADGTLIRGADGAAGDVGHVRASLAAKTPCTCGSIGCLEAVASVRAVGLALGFDGSDQIGLTRSVMALIEQQDPPALRIVKEAAEQIGEVVVSLIHFVNPERVLVGGSLSMASDHLLAIIRSIVYSRALPLATRNLTMARPVYGRRSGLAGGLVMGLESELEPEALARRPVRKALPPRPRYYAR
ncbi:MAG: ROK family transcriptional regulator [Propionibacteriaceae bacterium]|jgi:predicted NBD/HSP70 family sugar kinase/biotin operon repressor|nr:ROK family transcriptional regulator [Propionibacteriaceae bacterium]